MITAETVRAVGDAIIEYESGHRSSHPSFDGRLGGRAQHAAVDAIRPYVERYLVPPRHRYGQTRTYELHMDALGRAQDRWRRAWEDSPIHQSIQVRQIVARVWSIHWSETQDLRVRAARDGEQGRQQIEANERSRERAQLATTPPATRAKPKKDTGLDRQ